MKKLVYLLGTLLLTAALAACSSSDLYDDPPEQPESHQMEEKGENENDGSGENGEVGVVPHNKLSNEFLTFMNEEFPDDINFVHSKNFFGGSYADSCIIINTSKEFEEAYHGKSSVPSLNFNDYTLVIGQVYNQGNLFQSISKNVLNKKTNGSYTMDIHVSAISGDNITVTNIETNLYFWSIYSKFESQLIKMNIIKERYE